MAWVQNSEKSLEEKRQHCKFSLIAFIFPFHNLDLSPFHFLPPSQSSILCNLLTPSYLPPASRKLSISITAPSP